MPPPSGSRSKGRARHCTQATRALPLVCPGLGSSTDCTESQLGRGRITENEARPPSSNRSHRSEPHCQPAPLRSAPAIITRSTGSVVPQQTLRISPKRAPSFCDHDEPPLHAPEWAGHQGRPHARRLPHRTCGPRSGRRKGWEGLTATVGGRHRWLASVAITAATGRGTRAPGVRSLGGPAQHHRRGGRLM